MLPSASGIVPLACEELFNAIEVKRADAKEGEEYQVLVSYLDLGKGLCKVKQIKKIQNTSDNNNNNNFIY